MDVRATTNVGVTVGDRVATNVDVGVTIGGDTEVGGIIVGFIGTRVTSIVAITIAVGMTATGIGITVGDTSGRAVILGSTVAIVATGVMAEARGVELSTVGVICGSGVLPTVDTSPSTNCPSGVIEGPTTVSVEF
ncbi:MAG: hypothetical protein HQ477_12680 [Chloroflexi bacterium]|nr:hypothetical protein [Chloroflexota bacterium]